jgi:hypothetical protein
MYVRSHSRTMSRVFIMDTGNHFGTVVECCTFLQACSTDSMVSKQDVIDSMEMRMHILLRRGVCNATFPYMGMSDWQIVTDVMHTP